MTRFASQESGQLGNGDVAEANYNFGYSLGCWIDPWREDCLGSIAVPMTASGLLGEKPMAIEVW